MMKQGGRDIVEFINVDRSGSARVLWRCKDEMVW